MKKVTLRVPATSANCGPGFDSLGFACTYYNEVTYELIDRGFQMEVEGEGKEYLKAYGGNLAFRSFFKVWNDLHDHKQTGLKVTMLNRIPMSRGLGSSSAAIVGGVMAANILSGNEFTKEQLLHYANEIEGHPDNVAPAIFGNFTVSYLEGKRPHSLVLQPAKPLKFIAVVPELKLSTALARAAIPNTIPHKDGVFNSSRTALLVGAIMSGEYNHLTAALEDKLHQPYRAHLIPGFLNMSEAAKAKGAYNAIISGAGSTVMAYADPDRDCEAIGAAMCEVFAKNGIESHYLLLDLDREGTTQIL